MSVPTRTLALHNDQPIAIQTPNQRKDTILIKNMLANVLGANRAIYWDHLHRFLCGVLPKPEFDSRAILLLDNYIYLHNTFVLAILHNIQTDLDLDTLPPPSLNFLPDASIITDVSPYATNTDAESKPVKDPVLTFEDRNKRKQREIASLDLEDRLRIQSIPRHVVESSNIYHRIPDPIFLDKIFLENLSCTQLRDIPNREQLRQRIQILSALNGLTGPLTNDCLEVIEMKIEAHVKNILTTAKSRLIHIQSQLLHNKSNQKKSSNQADYYIQTPDLLSVMASDTLFSKSEVGLSLNEHIDIEYNQHYEDNYTAREIDTLMDDAVEIKEALLDMDVEDGKSNDIDMALDDLFVETDHDTVVQFDALLNVDESALAESSDDCINEPFMGNSNTQKNKSSIKVSGSGRRDSVRKTSRPKVYKEAEGEVKIRKGSGGIVNGEEGDYVFVTPKRRKTSLVNSNSVVQESPPSEGRRASTRISQIL